MAVLIGATEDVDTGSVTDAALSVASLVLVAVVGGAFLALRPLILGVELHDDLGVITFWAVAAAIPVGVGTLLGGTWLALRD